MRVYYNEWDDPTAAWLRELGQQGLIPCSYVDTRSIRDVRADDVRDFDQCHFFAGIGGWALALQLAGYAGLRCWTGSPPCQPFSIAGRGLAQTDERHLAPAWLDLIGECRPPAIFGEQVADAIGRRWLDDLFDALEGYGYACGAAVLPACSVGAPHIRKRLFFGAVRLANASCEQHDGRGLGGQGRRLEHSDGSAVGRMADMHGNGRKTRRELRPIRAEHDVEHGGAEGWVADTSGAGLALGERIRRVPGPASGASAGQDATHGSNDDGTRSVGTCPDHGGWDRVDWIGCRDGKFRPVEPSIFPLVDGFSGPRVGILRGAGNAIVPQVAAAFIEEFLGAFAESREVT